MKTPQWVLAAVLLSAGLLSPAEASECYLSIGVGYDRHIDEGRNPMSVIRAHCVLSRELMYKGDYLSVEYDHHSSVFNGRPFNHLPEDLADQLSVVYTIRLW